MDQSAITIYVLHLEGDCYYVGKTSNLDQRIAQHFGGQGAAWTKLHPPIELVESFEGDEFDEDKYVKKYMKIHGIDKVRGGSYVTTNLNAETIKHLEKELNSSSDGCFRCGKTGHSVMNCKSYKNHEGRWLCRRCDRVGHTAKECYAKAHLNGHVFTSHPQRRH